MAEVRRYISKAEQERENYLSICRTIRGLALDGPALGGVAICLIGVAGGVAKAVYQLDEGALASFTYAATSGLAGLVLGTVVAVGGSILGGLADADSSMDNYS